MADGFLAVGRNLTRVRAFSFANWARICVAVVILGFVAASLAITAGTRAIPQNDDWSYVKAALILAREGRIELQGWGQMFQLGQLITAQPVLWIFGDRTASLDLYGELATVVWLGCAYLVGRRCVGERRALLLVAVIICWPGMALLASSFMTDLPSAAASLVAVAAGIAAIKRESRLLMAGSLLAALLAFTIREQLVVAFLAVLLGAWLTRGVSRRFRLEFTAGSVVLVVVCTVLERFRHSLPNGDLPPYGFASLNFSKVPTSLLPCLFTIGLAVSPLALWNLLNLRRKGLIDPGRLVGWGLGLLAIVAVGHGIPSRVILTNYVTTQAAFPIAVVGLAPTMLSPGCWEVLQVLAMIGGVALAGEVGARLAGIRSMWRGWRAGETAGLVMTAYTLLLLAFVIGLSFGGETQYDRYLIAIFPGAGLLLLRPAAVDARSLRKLLVGVIVGLTSLVLVATSLLITISTDVRDAAIWNTARELRAQGIPATNINAGLDWNGYHATTAVPPQHRGFRVGPPYPGQHWISIFRQSRDCYLVTVSPMQLAGLELVSQTRHGPYGLDGAITTYVYHRRGCS